MREQIVQNRQPRWWEGILIVLAIALLVLAGNAVFSWLALRIGTLASVGFIAYGCAIAWFLLNWYALSFVYTATDDVLRICRAYGKRERFAADIWLNRVVAWGTPEDMKQRYPQAKVLRDKEMCTVQFVCIMTLASQTGFKENEMDELMGNFLPWQSISRGNRKEILHLVMRLREHMRSPFLGGWSPAERRRKPEAAKSSGAGEKQSGTHVVELEAFRAKSRRRK